MPSVSSLDTITPADLPDMADRGAQDVLIRQQNSDSLVARETVQQLLAFGPYTYAFFGSTASNVTVTSASSTVFNFESPTVSGIYTASQWWDAGSAENCVAPEAGNYVIFFQTEVLDGAADDQFYAKIVADPGGANITIRTVSGHTKGTGERVSVNGFYVVTATAGQSLGLQIQNAGLADLAIVSVRTNILIVKLG